MNKPVKMSMYEKEYTEVIQQMSNICRTIVWNSNPSNNKVMIDE